MADHESYCDISGVKTVLHLDLAGTGEDAELALCMLTGIGLVDGFLKEKGLVVPSVIPQLVVDAATNFSAWSYRRVRDPVGAQVFWDTAMQFLQTYANAELVDPEPHVGSV